jgi:hypothetical protein
MMITIMAYIIGSAMSAPPIAFNQSSLLMPIYPLLTVLLRVCIAALPCSLLRDTQLLAADELIECYQVERAMLQSELRERVSL